MLFRTPPLTLIPLFLFVCFTSNGQSLIGVDTYTGAALIDVPFWTVQSGDLSYPLSISYAGQGIKVADASGRLGVGWNTTAVGTITREIRGFPDDYSDDLRKGWLVDGTHSLIGSFNPPTANDLSNCTNEHSTFSFLHSLGGFDDASVRRDTEPDIYTINVRGLTGSFVFANDGSIRFFSDENYKVTHSLDEDGLITGFVVVNDRGVEYHFGEPNNTYWNTTAGNDPPSFLSRSHYFYNTVTSLKAPTLWHLLRIKSPSHHEITFDYGSHDPIPWYTPQPTPPNHTGTFPLLPLGKEEIKNDVFLYDPDQQEYTLHGQDQIEIKVPTPKQVQAIRTKTHRVELLNNQIILPQGDYDLGFSILNWVHIYDVSGEDEKLVRRIVFDYATIKQNGFEDRFSHIYLRSMTTGSELSEAGSYFFEYYGVDLENKSAYITERNPDLADPYGFYGGTFNSGQPVRLFVYPDLPTEDRMRYYPIPGYTGDFFVLDGKYAKADMSLLTAGSLKRITTPNGGIHDITYEPNSYYDQLAGMNVYGGGLRVKKVERYSADPMAETVVEKYSYEDDAGNSSGRLLYKPQYAFQLNFHEHPVTGNITYFKDMAGLPEEEVFKRLLVRTKRDIGPGASGPALAYSRVTSNVPGGTHVINYSIPVYHGVSQHNEWKAGNTWIAREAPEFASQFDCQPIPDLQGTFKFPHGTLSNYRRQGLPESEYYYDETGSPVKSYHYSYSFETPYTIVQGITFDRYVNPQRYQVTFDQGTSWVEANLPFFMYQPYEYFVGSRVARTQSIERTYTNSVARRSTTVNYSYESSSHHYLTRQETILDNGKKFEERFTYPQDYVPTSPWANRDAMSRALTKMQLYNMLSLPIERLSVVTDGTDETISGGSVGLFEYGSTDDQIHLVREYVLDKPVALNTFVPSGVSNGSGSTFLFDQNNFKDYSEFADFHKNNIPQSIKSTRQSKAGSHYDAPGFLKTSISGALADEVLFTDFEHSSDFELQYVETNWTGPPLTNGRIAGSALDFQSGSLHSLSGTLTKVQNDYVLSFWYKSDQNSNLQLVFSDGTNPPVNVTCPVSIRADWQYYEQEVDLSGLSDAVDVSMQSSAALIIDDILIAPYHAGVSHHLYGSGGLKLAETTNGQTNSYVYDDLGRLSYIRDHAGHIRQKQTYSQKGDRSLWHPGMTYSSERYVGESIDFLATPSSFPGAASYKWSYKEIDQANFGTPIVTTDPTVGLTFNLEGPYVVRLEITYSGETKWVDKRIRVSERPVTIEICSNFGTRIDACQPTPRLANPGCSTDTDRLTLKATVTNSPVGHTFEWAASNLNGGQETLLTGNSSIIKISNYRQNRLYRCRVKNASGERIGEAGISIRIFQSDPYCSIPNPQ